MHINAFLFHAGMCRGNRSWESTEHFTYRGTSGHGGDCSSVQSPPSPSAGGADSSPAPLPWLSLRAALSTRTAVLPGLWQSARNVLCTLLMLSMVLRSRWMAEK